MKRYSLILLASLFISISTFAQETSDVVNTKGNTEDVFYLLEDGSTNSAVRNNWDIAFENKGFAASILINGQKGVTLYSSPYTVDDWASFDSTGMASWPQTINSTESWSSGAFNQNLASDYDLGWGVYDVSSHVISGDSIFLIKLADGSLYKMFVNELAASTYKFTYANVDGTGEQVMTMKKSSFGAQNFGYYAFDTKSAVVREPDTDKWDVVFTQYLSPIAVGPGQFQNYPVSGVKINKGVQVAQRDGIAVTSDDTTNLNWNTNITEIGSDWKSWNGTAYEYAQDRAYFLRLANGDVWKLYFTKYVGGGSGEYSFTKKKIAGNSGIEKEMAQNIQIYPNPSNGQAVHILLEDQNEFNQVTVFNQAMQQVGSSNVPSVNVENMVAGVYFLQIETANYTAVKRIVIQ